jgi:hypothetical protein
VSVNGSWPTFDARETDRLLFPTGIYTHHVAEHRAYDFRVPLASLRDGWNEVLVSNGTKATPAQRRANAVRVVSLELAVRKK